MSFKFPDYIFTATPKFMFSTSVKHIVKSFFFRNQIILLEYTSLTIQGWFFLKNIQPAAPLNYCRPVLFLFLGGYIFRNVLSCLILFHVGVAFKFQAPSQMACLGYPRPASSEEDSGVARGHSLPWCYWCLSACVGQGSCALSTDIGKFILNWCSH